MKFKLNDEGPYPYKSSDMILAPRRLIPFDGFAVVHSPRNDSIQSHHFKIIMP